jgi:hypothetical protein
MSSKTYKYKLSLIIVDAFGVHGLPEKASISWFFGFSDSEVDHPMCNIKKQTLNNNQQKSTIFMHVLYACLDHSHVASTCNAHMF